MASALKISTLLRFSATSIRALKCNNVQLDEYFDVRKESAIAFGNLSNPQALNALQQALNDPDKDVSIYSQRAIQKIQQVGNKT